MGAVRRLSYPAIRTACAPRYHRFQTSPYRFTRVTPDACSPRLGQRLYGFPHPRGGPDALLSSLKKAPAFASRRVYPVTRRPVSVSPNIPLSNQLIGSKEVGTSSPRCHAASPIRGTARREIFSMDWRPSRETLTGGRWRVLPAVMLAARRWRVPMHFIY